MSGAPNPYQSANQTTPQIPNYLVQSILVTVFCCIPFGIVAIIKAASVNGKIAAGDIAGAQEASQSAKKWCWISLGIGLTINIIVIVLQVVAAIAAVQQGGAASGSF